MGEVRLRLHPGVMAFLIGMGLGTAETGSGVGRVKRRKDWNGFGYILCFQTCLIMLRGCGIVAKSLCFERDYYNGRGDSLSNTKCAKKHLY
jgi:hypothetical protein